MRFLRQTARLRLTLSYVAFLLAAGFAMSVIVYAVMRFVPNYPLTAANPSDAHLFIASRGQILDSLIQACVVAMGALAVVGTVGGWLVAGRVLRPLTDLNTAAQAAASGDLSHRISARGTRRGRDEFTDLADTFDTMLERLERAFAAQQRFAANASHELRTPLAVTQTMLDVAREDPDAVDLPRLLERLDVTNRRATDLVAALLQLAALDRSPIVRAPFDLDVVVEDAVDDVAREATERGVRVEVDVAPAVVPGDEVLLARVVDNLLRNAIRHNLPQGGWARIALVDAGLVVLTVENSGRVLTDDELRIALEPFARQIGSVARTRDDVVTDRSSNGLGLAIVSRIVELHGGSLSLTPLPGGGVSARVVIPRGARPVAAVRAAP
ncbi:sensor histidine kinase [Oerskovia rustica]|uniref:sensor histidine kinase n=1 Tax=Oerskovia rustica TaxID=2762237 RepID=UPI00296B0793|nr:HAMP domain-containing sensor histidine kinase [Oerskovia rustica]